MKEVELTSKVLEGHHLDDIDRHIPYDGSIRISLEEANQSNDLNRAVQQGLVEKKGEYQTETSHSPQITTSSLESPSDTEESEPTEESQKSPFEELLEKHHELLDRVDQLVETQQTEEETSNGRTERLLEKLVDAVEDQPLISAQPEQSDLASSSEEENDTSTTSFIPSDIDTSDMSGEVEAEESEEKEGSELSDASEALKSMQESE